MIQAIRSGRLAAEWWIVALVTTALAIGLVYDRTTQRLDRLVYDLVLRLEERTPDPRILIVAIDDRSVAEVGSWPWPREVQARLIERLAEGSPKAVGYDVLLTEPRRGDAALGRAVAGPVSVFVPLLMVAPGANGAPFDTILPVAAVAENARGIGHVNLIVDGDGKVRRVRLWEGGDRAWPHLVELLRRAAVGGQDMQPRTDPLLIPFSGAAGAFPTIGASSVLRGQVPAEVLRDRLVLVGATAGGLGDRYATAGGNRHGVMPGVEIQAQMLDGLLSGSMIKEGGLAARVLFALLPVWILLLALRKLQPGATLVLLAALLAGTLGLAAALLLEFRLWLTPVPALAGLALVYPLWGWRRLAGANSYLIEELERFHAEPDALSASSSQVYAADPVSRQILLLNQAIAQARDLRRFTADSLRQIPDSVFVADRDGRILFANAEAESLLPDLRQSPEFDMQALFARFEPLEQIAGGDGQEPARAPSWPPDEASAGGQYLCADGRCFDVRAAPRRSADGAHLGWIVRLTDITEVWTAQRQREDMLQFLSHDMRSPQASILAVLAEGSGRGIAPELAARIEGYAERTMELADGFVQLARAETLEYEPEPIGLSDVLLDAVDHVWPRITAKRIALDTEGEDAPLLVHGERSLVTRAVINLLENAVRHSPEAGRIACRLDRIEEQGKAFAVCTIADEGPGIEESRIATLFDRFQQGPAADRSSGSAGLGLSLVRAVVARHCGWVRCESRPGEGATFTIGLPLAAEDPADPSCPEPGRTQPPGAGEVHPPPCSHAPFARP
ncbi:CHASE2 domain-containing protein [Altererythrobacter soli]|uniref:histidine kinase n=1 Tax=Croceibacterium soli TaxID=1739690 RepID=A0A6I4UVN7_9SPHN|nr:CHASE2 domain-containing protein [Croceibacterium soli]MXP41914.1 CHASE2 domain-containing protein [Croceibacterium soli]